MKLSSLITAAALSVAAIPAAVQAQTTPASQIMNTLPPALRAAVLNGNTQAIQQAITTLAAGNPAQMANLAASVARAAEGLLATNPAAALAAATAALNVAKIPAVQSSSPTQTQAVLLTVARISANPNVRQLDPVRANLLASEVQSVVAASPTLQTGTFAAEIASALPRSVNTTTGSGPSGSPASSGSSGGSGGGTSAR